MIISASRRTDIPAFYAEWLIGRLWEGMVLVRNPINFHQISRIALSPARVECLVFWSKNPGPLLDKLTIIDDLGYTYYFLFTLTPYDAQIEANVPAVADRIKTFQNLARRIGKEKVLWRYDPILFTKRYTPDFHTRVFTTLASQLAGHTDKCIVSFIEMYRKCRRNMANLQLLQPTETEHIDCLHRLQQIAAAQGIALQTCAPGESLQKAGIAQGKCIDDRLVAGLIGHGMRARKDGNQRPACGCVESIDIGAYNSCPHGCLYCYANNDQASVAKNQAAHSPASPLLFGGIGSQDRITDRIQKSCSDKQQRLF